MKKTILMLTAAAGLAFGGIAAAASAAIDEAKAQCIVGEQADGYLGIVDPMKASAELRREVRENNQQRKAIYAESASRNGTTIEIVAALTAEKLINEAPSGQCVRDQNGTWLRKP
jgi:hypothetical protein